MNKTTIHLVNTAGDSGGNARLSTQQIVSLKAQRYGWSCDRCGYSIPIPLDQVEVIPWFIVRHLLGVHQMTPADIAEAEPCLLGEVRDYCAQMGIG